MKVVDARGELCPKPLIMTKKALVEIDENDSLEILIDNETSMKNVSRFLTDNGMEIKQELRGNVFHLFVGKTGEIPENAPVEEYCEVSFPSNKILVIAFQKELLGEGAEELGRILMKAFVNTLPEATNQPQSIVFLNSGIFLALKDSQVLDTLIKLEKNGVEILVCGTCLDYYQKKQELGVGKVSNMYDILERLTSASSVVYP